MHKPGFQVKAALLRLLLVAALSGCQATQYQPIASAGGFGEMELEGNIWRIRFSHNVFTTRETAQSYWLYRAAELTMSKGYDGFEILSQTGLARSSGDTLSRSSSLLIQGEIRMLKKPFESAPPRIYNAAALRAVLDPYVTGAKTGPTAVSSKVETPPSSSAPSGSDALGVKLMESPATIPAAAPAEKPRPAPLVARPQRPPAADAQPPLKPTGPCEVKPVMTDQDLVNCGARVR